MLMVQAVIGNVCMRLMMSKQLRTNTALLWNSCYRILQMQTMLE